MKTKQRKKEEGRGKKANKKPLSGWQRFKRFAFTFELTPENIRRAIDKRKKVKGKRKKAKIGPSKRTLIYSFVFISLLVFISIYLLKDVPSPTKLASGEFPVSSQIFDRNGELLYEIYSDQNRTPIKLSDLPPYVKQATIAIEDKNFYRHFGIDPIGVIRATIRNTQSTLNVQRSTLSLQGGSTITQQLVKMTLLTPERSLSRKIREAALAVATEILYTKDQILEMYLNHAPYGGTAYGIEQAAQRYFGKHAHDLSLPEAALLAGLPQAPSAYSPFGSRPENAKDRQLEVLRRMREDKYITPQREKEASEQVLAYSTEDIPIRSPHFVLWIKDLLIEKFGQKTVEGGGLRVTTTLDLAVQETAQASLSAEVKKLKGLRVGNGAALVTNPGTGEILAMVGSKDYFDAASDGNVNVTIRPRQPGSSIKPLMYASGFSTGKLLPSTMWLDIPTCFAVPGQPRYCPKNYDGAFHGPTQIRFALGNSYNLPAVKSLAYIGVEDMIATASAMGISTFVDPSRYGLSLTLGGGEVTMLDMATAFGTLANSGVKVPLDPFLKIEDYKGEVLYQRSSDERLGDLKFVQNTQKTQSPGESEKSASQKVGESGSPSFPSVPKQVIPPEAAYLVSHILLDNNARSSAFGPTSQLVIPGQVVSVKTGTSNDLRDNWTLGYTPELLTAVWVGNNDNKPMNQALVSGVTGAAPIWHDIMSQLLKTRKPIWPEKPEGVVARDVCNLTGLLVGNQIPETRDQIPTCDTRHEFFWEKFLPENNRPVQREIWIRKDTGAPVDPAIPLDQQGELELQMHTVISDPLVREFCLDCSYPVEQELNPDGTVKEERINYPGSVIDTTKMNR